MHINLLVERFLRQHDLSPTRFGRLAARDPRLVFDIRSGRELGSEMEQTLRKFMAHYQSADTPSQKSAA
jgi:hypothetical protein